MLPDRLRDDGTKFAGKEDTACKTGAWSRYFAFAPRNHDEVNGSKFDDVTKLMR
jgi:hypothetical protein